MDFLLILSESISFISALGSNFSYDLLECCDNSSLLFFLFFLILFDLFEFLDILEVLLSPLYLSFSTRS